MAERRLTWMQERVLEQIADGKWHDVPAIATNSVIRGLISRGLVEHKKRDPDSPVAHLEWIKQGRIRLVRSNKRSK